MIIQPQSAPRLHLAVFFGPVCVTALNWTGCWKNKQNICSLNDADLTGELVLCLSWVIDLNYRKNKTNTNTQRKTPKTLKAKREPLKL